MDLKIITDESEIRKLYNSFFEKLKLAADTNIKINICLPNQIVRNDIHWSNKYLFWWSELPKQKIVLGNYLPEINTYISTPCYFTIPYIYNARCGGAFAIDEDNKKYLINKANFFLIKYDTNKVLSSREFIDEYYTGVTVNTITNKKSNKAIMVCCMESNNFYEQIALFVKKVVKIKTLVENPKESDSYKPIEKNDINNLRKSKKKLTTIGESLFWSYANLGAVHAAMKSGDTKLHRIHYIIRSKLYNGLTNGTMNISTFYKDEKQKIILPRCCCYCGSTQVLSADHVIPRKKGGNDSGENLVWCCQKCNSSKSSNDLLEWMFNKNEFPSILLLRRYLKLAIQYCNENNIMNWPLKNIEDIPVKLPFSIHSLPYRFPNLNKLKIWIIDFEGMNSA